MSTAPSLVYSNNNLTFSSQEAAAAFQPESRKRKRSFDDASSSSESTASITALSSQILNRSANNSLTNRPSLVPMEIDEDPNSNKKHKPPQENETDSSSSSSTAIVSSSVIPAESQQIESESDKLDSAVNFQMVALNSQTSKAAPPPLSEASSDARTRPNEASEEIDSKVPNCDICFSEVFPVEQIYICPETDRPAASKQAGNHPPSHLSCATTWAKTKFDNNHPVRCQFPGCGTDISHLLPKPGFLRRASDYLVKRPAVAILAGGLPMLALNAASVSKDVLGWALALLLVPSAVLSISRERRITDAEIAGVVGLLAGVTFLGQNGLSLAIGLSTGRVVGELSRRENLIPTSAAISSLILGSAYINGQGLVAGGLVAGLSTLIAIGTHTFRNL